MRIRNTIPLVVLFTVVALAAPAHARGHTAGTPASGAVVVVQAVPGLDAAITIDGKATNEHAAVGTVTPAARLTPGSHTITFASNGGTMSSTVQVAAGSSTDVVLHRPASVNGKPVVNTYAAPLSSLGPDKARLMLAHTATVAPADASFDGKVVFTNIANGEFATADVPAGHHQVALFPTGQTTSPFLGPIPVDLKPGTATMVYAVGNPEDSSMKVIVHVEQVSAGGGRVPDRIKTGSAGLAAHDTVVTFGPAILAARTAARIARWR